MRLTPPTTPPSSRIRIHSPYLHARLPQMFPLIQYTKRSSDPHSTELQTETSLTQTSPTQTSSITQTKKMCRQPQYPQPLVLVPPFEPKCSEEPKCLSHSPAMTPSIEPLSRPSQGCETMSTVATRTSSRLKRSLESAGLSSSAEPPTMTKRPRYSLPNWTTSEGWNRERRQIPLHHHHPLMSPFRHQPYRATHKSQPVPRPPAPESVEWPADRLRPSKRVPVDHGVRGLKLVTWELKYRLFQKAFESELSCCLLARQEELKRRLP